MESPMELKAWPVFANIEVDFLAKVKSVWVYREYKCEGAMILTNEDEVFAIGSNKYGRHGVGDTQPATNPRKVPALSHKQVVEISFGSGFALALTQDGTIYSWGENDKGQLGRETTNDGLTPMPIEGPLRGKMVNSVSCGFDHSLALTDSGEVFAWGNNEHGQLGDGSRINAKVPKKIKFQHLVPEECHAVQISCGADFSIILLNDGRILSFGYSRLGQLGHGNNENQSTPAIIKALRQTKIVSVSCGWCHVLALSDMGHLYSWGWNCYGQLGNGSRKQSSVPTRIGDKSTRFTAIETNWASCMSAALNESSQTYVWGRCKGDIFTPTETQYKSLPEAFYFHSHEGCSMFLRAIRFTSSGTSDSQPSCLSCCELKAWPVFANIEPDFLAKVKSVWVYREYLGEGAMILTIEDEVFGIGSNKYGQHGVGDTQPATNPRKVPALSNQQVVEISLGDEFALALTQDGTIYSWGCDNRFGQLGRKTTNDGLIPMPIEGPLRGKRVTSIACGGLHSLALTDSGEVFAWGRNDRGQLGDGSQNDSMVPKKIQFEHLVPEGCHAQQISCGALFSIILLNDGRILSFGNSNYGQLGHGNKMYQSTPAIIKALRQTKLVSVSCGNYHVLALSDMGHLYSWGRNECGQLGNGSTENSSVPTRIGDKSTRFTAIETNWASSMSAALNESSQTYVWGRCKVQLGFSPLTETQYKSLPEAVYFHSHENLPICLREIRFTSSGTSESQPRSGSRFLQEYEPLSWLGSGASGAVMKVRCIHEVDKALMAVKMIEFDEKSRKEIGFLKRLTHENVVGYYSGWVEEISDSWVEQLKKAMAKAEANDPEAKNGKGWRDIQLPKGYSFLFIATELCSRGTLHDYIFMSPDKPIKESWKKFLQIVSAISYIHMKKIIHRDLKPANIFVGADGNIKIGDFGLARSLEKSSMAKTRVGTQYFMAPEISLKGYNHKVDIFAAGKILAFLIYPLKSYKDTAARQYFEGIRSGTSIQNGLDELISKMINEKPEMRPDASELVGLQCPIDTNCLANPTL